MSLPWVGSASKRRTAPRVTKRTSTIVEGPCWMGWCWCRLGRLVKWEPFFGGESKLLLNLKGVFLGGNYLAAIMVGLGWN